MPEPATILFFSDAHFGAHGPEQEAEKSRRFVSFLQHAAAERAEVFFLGDLFDFWFEYRHWIPKYRIEIGAAIHAFTHGGGVFHLIVGNHDCWAQDYFEKQLGVTLHRGDLATVRQGMRLYISHGDGKAPSDRGYRLLRRVLRARISIRLYRLLPADMAYRLAHFSSGQSRDVTGKRPPGFLEEYNRVAETLLKSGFDAVIMGHVHQAWVRRSANGWWINTGEWYDSYDYVILQEGLFRLEQWAGARSFQADGLSSPIMAPGEQTP
jgi:UDP-2,3-diacylglucosamine hydrolase